MNCVAMVGKGLERDESKEQVQPQEPRRSWEINFHLF